MKELPDGVFCLESPQPPEALTLLHDPGHSLCAQQLSGGEEVPVRLTGAQGQAIFHLSKDGTALEYKLIASNIENVVAAHIHLGPADCACPVVAFLYGNAPPAGGRTNGVLAEGVITAAAMRCLGGEIYARLVVEKPEHEERCRAMGITDFKRIYRSKDLASGENIVFAATGVTDGNLMKGVRFFGDGIRTTSLVMQTQPHRIRFIDSIHVNAKGPTTKIRF